MTEPQPLPQREPDSISEDDMPTVPIPARKVVTTFDAASKHERIEVKPPLTRLFRRTITRAFNKWVTFSTSMVLNPTGIRAWNHMSATAPNITLD